MSSEVVAVAADEVTVAAGAVVPRRFPPPCWTQEEALILIDVYRERWYALRRGYLRTADWDAVAAAVASRFPGASPAKTSAQCRHKIEKLRQRYRAEKQRALSLPSAGRYFSSWFFFDNMEAMENGTTLPPPAPAQRYDISSDGSRLNSFVDQNMLKLKLKPESSPDLVGYNSATAIPIQYSSYLDTAIADKDDDRPMNRIPIAFPSRQPKLFRDRGGSRHQIFPVPGLRNEKFGSDYGPGARTKRGRSGLEEIVASIKLMGEGFVKMEKEKMEMSREMEVKRMEMEMKRNQMMVESQKQILDAFLKGLVEINKRKSKKVKPGFGVAENSAEP